MTTTQTIHHSDLAVLRFIADSYRMGLPALWDSFHRNEQQCVLDLKDAGLVEGYAFDATTRGHRPTAKGLKAIQIADQSA